MARFVLEIGTEEVPARFLPSLERELADRFAAALGEAGYILSAPVEVFSTPRRAAVSVSDIEETQPLREELVMGPPARVAYDAEGQPTKAAEGFARTLGIDVADLRREQNEKGEYVAGMKKSGGLATVEVLASICPDIIAALPFAKRMRWGCGSFAYARPIRWILALLDEKIVPFAIAGISSGRCTFGHRVMGPGPFEVAEAKDYLEVVREKGQVEPRAAERRALIRREGEAGAAAVGGKVIWNDKLLDEVQGLVEHPVPLVASIDPSFLQLPREVLLTSMESHQKSFGLEDANGALMPYFLTVLNLVPRDMAVVRKGWERVLRARLEDARFFWKGDLESSFDAWLASLENVIFLAPLGSMGEKTRRISALCGWLAERTGQNVALAERAGRLSKADLVSSMVGEFDTLQGIMGGIYARKMGEDGAVADALSEQYLPAGPDTPVPATDLGSILSIADKADTLVGCFGLGMIPTGAADPYALRRCALGIIRIMLEKGYTFDVAALFAKARELYGEREWKLPAESAAEKLRDFFAGRVRNYFLAQGHATPLVDAVTAVHCDQVCFTERRLNALSAMSHESAFAGTAQTFKRVANIIRKQDAGLDGSWNPSLLREEAEKALAQALSSLFTAFDQHWEAGDAAALFADLASIQPAVDAFFNGVMVMCDEPELRSNRLNMLKALHVRMEKMADFAALQL